VAADSATPFLSLLWTFHAKRASVRDQQGRLEHQCYSRRSAQTGVNAMPQSAARLPLADSRDGTVYLVLDRAADLKTVVTDLLSGRYRHPLRVVAFDPVEGSMCDVSAEIARQVLSRAVETNREVPVAVRDFVERAGVPL
jgi:hypothetical protein